MASFYPNLLKKHSELIKKRGLIFGNGQLKRK
jgi:hypothetical protein